MRYAQIKAGRKLHLIELYPDGGATIPLCGYQRFNSYRMTINMPLGNACKNCIRSYSAGRRFETNISIKEAP